MDAGPGSPAPRMEPPSAGAGGAPAPAEDGYLAEENPSEWSGPAAQPGAEAEAREPSGDGAPDGRQDARPGGPPACDAEPPAETAAAGSPEDAAPGAGPTEGGAEGGEAPARPPGGGGGGGGGEPAGAGGAAEGGAAEDTGGEARGAPAEGAAEEEENEDDGEEEEEDDEEEEDSDDSYIPHWSGGGKDSDDNEEEADGTDDPWAADGRQREPQRMHTCIHHQRVDALRDLASAEPSLLQEVDKLGRTPLHLALLRCQPDAVAALLGSGHEESVARAVKTPFRGAGSSSKDSLPTLHLALAAAPLEGTAQDALRCLELLLAQERLDLNEPDNGGRTVLHLACGQGSAHVLDTILRHRADPGARDDLGQLPLHYAIDSHSQQCVQKMLGASDPSLFDGGLHPFYRCIDRQAWGAAFLIYRQGWPIPEADINRLFDFAAARGLATEWNFVSEKGVEGSCSLEELQWPSETFSAASTALVTHSVCLSHGVLPLDVDDPSLRHRLIRQTPENPHRLEVLCGERGILRSVGFRDLRWIGEPAPAPLTDVLRVHEDWYVHGLIERVREASALGPSKRIVLDGGDTKVTQESWNAALRACGCVLEAVELVCNEQVRNAFCAVRPPGHHLGPGGACNTSDLEDDPEGSQGFCLLNNVAVGAAYARCVYRHVIRKVAIVDFDVHHGNGTEAAVRRVKWKRNEADFTREFVVRGVRAKLSASAPASCKPWLDPESDAESLFFASVHGYGGGFYPGTGASCSERSPRIVNVGLRAGSGSADFRAAVRGRVLPELLAFGPDLLLLSAGFDGHEDDLVGNCRCTQEDYIWVTKQMMSVANRCCQGRLISVLEGGYNTRAELLSPFAQSVAGHIQTLMHTSSNYCHLECEAQASEDRQADASREANAARRKRRRADLQEPDEAAAEEPAPKVAAAQVQ